ncbi:MAG: potassium-transporting ATPase subunit F [Pseudanabaenaceae cyanobacterium bins.68]|nr:potassium-transporting ATPase subunit F [Pseudanabaenaceae cyanobacterium bins.68]
MKLPLFSEVQHLWRQINQPKIARSLFFLLCLNLITAPALQAATGSEFSRAQAYALGVLLLLTFCFSIYLFVVMFQPERF